MELLVRWVRPTLGPGESEFDELFIPGCPLLAVFIVLLTLCVFTTCRGVPVVPWVSGAFALSALVGLLKHCLPYGQAGSRVLVSNRRALWVDHGVMTEVLRAKVDRVSHDTGMPDGLPSVIFFTTDGMVRIESTSSRKIYDFIARRWGGDEHLDTSQPLDLTRVDDQRD